MKEITKKDILKSLTSFAKDNKLTRNSYRANKNPNDPSIGDIENKFGSWASMVEELSSSLTIEEGPEDRMDHFDSNYELVKKVNRKGLYKVFVVPDIHVPFQSEKALECTMRIAEAYEPDEIIQLGDLCDFYKISRYVKTPGRGVSIQKEIDEAIVVLDNLKKRSGAKSATLLQGNHESRIQKYLCNQAPGLADLNNLKLEKLLELKSIGWNLIPEHQFYQINNVYFTHGEFVTSHSALKHLSTYNETIVHGHTHRLSCVMTKYLSKTIEAWEMGCLASLKVSQEYQKAANWQHGCGTVDIYNADYWIRPHHIRDGAVVYNDKLIEA